MIVFIILLFPIMLISMVTGLLFAKITCSLLKVDWETNIYGFWIAYTIIFTLIEVFWLNSAI